MGYYTNYYGTITLSSSRFSKIIELMRKEQLQPFEYGDGLSIDNNVIEVSAEWKDYDNIMEKICSFIKTLDKDAIGEIDCDGEEKNDSWKIILSGKCLEIWRAKIHFEKESSCEVDKTMVMRVKEILENGDFNKRVLVESLN